MQYLESKQTISIVFRFFLTMLKQLLHFVHIWKTGFHKLSSSFPHFEVLYPQKIRMWINNPHREFPHGFFLKNAQKQANERIFMWKTMWKLWKSPSGILPHGRGKHT